MEFGSHRAIKGDTVLSPSLPRLGIRVSPDYVYLGNMHYISANTYHVEQYLFINPSGIGHITNILLVHFAGFLVNKPGAYIYASQKTVQLEGEEYLYENRLIDIYDYVRRSPGTELAHAADYIRQRSYTLAGSMRYQRFTRLVSPDRRNEFVVAYLESCPDEKEAADGLGKAESEALLDRALKSFTIVV
jgi:hypothetical protein